MGLFDALRDALPSTEDDDPPAPRKPRRVEGVHHSPPPPVDTTESAATCGNTGSTRVREPHREPPTVNPPTLVEDAIADAWYSRKRILWATRDGDVIDATQHLIEDPRHDGEVTTPYVLLASGWTRDEVMDLIDPVPDEPEDDEDEDQADDHRMGLDERVRWLLDRIDQAPLDAPVVVANMARYVRDKFGCSDSTAKRLARRARDIHAEEMTHDDPDQ